MMMGFIYMEYMADYKKLIFWKILAWFKSLDGSSTVHECRLSTWLMAGCHACEERTG